MMGRKIIGLTFYVFLLNQPFNMVSCFDDGNIQFLIQKCSEISTLSEDRILKPLQIDITEAKKSQITRPYNHCSLLLIQLL